MAQKCNADDTSDFCIILTDNKQDQEYFFIECDIPAIKTKHNGYFDFAFSQKVSDDDYCILRNTYGFEECYEKVLKISCSLKERFIKKIIWSFQLQSEQKFIHSKKKNSKIFFTLYKQCQIPNFPDMRGEDVLFPKIRSPAHGFTQPHSFLEHSEFS